MKQLSDEDLRPLVESLRALQPETNKSKSEATRSRKEFAYRGLMKAYRRERDSWKEQANRAAKLGMTADAEHRIQMMKLVEKQLEIFAEMAKLDGVEISG